MSWLLEAAQELATSIHREEAPAFPYVPEGLVTPSLVVQPSENYLAPADTSYGGEWAISLDVWLLVSLDDNETAAEELGELLEHLAQSLPEGWGLDRVEQPGPVSTSEWLAHGCKATCSAYVKP